MVTPCPCQASLPGGAFRCQYPRQEPSAVVPHAGIRAGGHPQGWSLPRPWPVGVATVVPALLTAAHLYVATRCDTRRHCVILAWSSRNEARWPGDSGLRGGKVLLAFQRIYGHGSQFIHPSAWSEGEADGAQLFAAGFGDAGRRPWW